MKNVTCESCSWLSEDTTEELRFCEELEIYVDPDEFTCKCYEEKKQK